MRNRVTIMNVIPAAPFGSLMQGAPSRSAPARPYGVGVGSRFLAIINHIYSY